ncbi:SRPBCC domain-containing protein [Paenibacillus sp. SC116]|uniref:SRPBCC domain-containing protein n=1 Tax=Paenibacillus sp. SC116 TaxID=2968986 RepID=UPI00215A9AAB|nr:SRPBCC domain-containing protein [Paenibacillus sp. SC116]MCR8845631.1 SRPBCC domain-containing protein [Paenibacillus sp. SC116]
MSKQLIVHNEVVIDAPASAVWEVLVNPQYIKQWDDLPEGYGSDHLALGGVIDWAGYSRLTVVEFEPQQRLRLALYVPKWPHPAEHYNIGYTFTLLQQGDHILLTVEIGDFAAIPNGDSYYEESVKFGNKAVQIIKQLAEQIPHR